MTILSVSPKHEDTRASVRTSELHAIGWHAITNLAITDLYKTDAKLTTKQKTKLAENLHNPVSQDVSSSKQHAPKTFDWAIEIGYLPGVTDNVANTVKEQVGLLFPNVVNEQTAVHSTQVTFLTGTLTRDEVESISKDLANPLIQAITILSAKEWQKNKGFSLPKVSKQTKKVMEPLNVPIDELAKKELIELGKFGIEDPRGFRRGPLALSYEQLQTIKKYFKKAKRQPTDIELECLAQNWSEHCRHTIFASPIDEISDGLFNHYIRRATETIRKKKGSEDICLSVFSDNAGAIIFDDEYAVCDKVETHNSPSALDPFGGAITGIVGVNRDVIGFGLGAKPILNRYGFCFPDPKDDRVLYRDEAQQREVLSSNQIIDGVIAGIGSGANCSGIPSPQGFLFHDKRYRAKPLVFAGTVGLIPRPKSNQTDYLTKKANPGDYIVMVGGRVGIDGIHGATFSSEAISASSPTSAVQIGDPITQKKLSDAVVKEARDKELFTSITDNGAGGLSCSVVEMSSEAGGCKVDLEKIPVKYPGIEPWQIWISESQERMTMAVDPEKWPELKKLLTQRGVEASVIGHFTDSGRCEVQWKDEIILDLELEFLLDGWPKLDQKTIKPVQEKSQKWQTQNADWTKLLQDFLQRENLRSFVDVSSQYDYEVQASSVLKPLQGKGQVNAETTAICPVLESDKAVAVSQSLYPTYTEQDPYAMAAATIDTAVRNLVASGVPYDHIALLDNFCWCSSKDPERLYQLKQAAKACHDIAVAYEIPYISGKDSMFNDFSGYDAEGKPSKISALPTLLTSSIGVSPDYRQLVGIDFQEAGELIYILGETHDELGGSEYQNHLQENGTETGTSPVPQLNPKLQRELYQTYSHAIKDKLIISAQPVNRGGILYSLAKMAMAGQLGVDVNLAQLPGTVRSDEARLFSESQGRIIVSIQPHHRQAFEKIFKKLPMQMLGTVTSENFSVYGEASQPLVATSVGNLHDAYTAHLPQRTNANTKQITPKALVLTGYGINCEEETAYAFEQAGAEVTTIHINDLIDSPDILKETNILAVPGGFSYGDDTGSGLAFANKMKLSLWKEIQAFYQRDTLTIGICNGFQILSNLGLLPGFENEIGPVNIALTHNDNAQYSVRWTDIAVTNTSPWLAGIDKLTVPIAHGEGKLVCDQATLLRLQQHGHIAARYIRGEISQHYNLAPNPNGSIFDIAAITDKSGKVLGMMPHPERAMFFRQLPHRTFKENQLKKHGSEIPKMGPGFALFENAVRYFNR